jgi:uncharacterized membrane protein YtjA (UPF0391 family)
MLGWTIFFFVLALIAAAFGFGAIASAFSGIALVLFWIFAALVVLSLLFSAFATRHGPAVVSGGRTLGLAAIAAVLGALIYAWVVNDWSAEQAGRALDQKTAALASDVSHGLDQAGARTQDFFAKTGDTVRDDAAGALDSAKRNVSPQKRDDRPADNQNNTQNN